MGFSETRNRKGQIEKRKNHFSWKKRGKRKDPNCNEMELGSRGAESVHQVALAIGDVGPGKSWGKDFQRCR